MLQLASLVLLTITVPRSDETLRVEAGTSLHDVLPALREACARGSGDVVVELAGGTYVLERPLVLDPRTGGDMDRAGDGTGHRAVTWRAATGAEVTWSGGLRITDWRLEDDGSWSTTAPRGRVRQLFVDGTRRPRARWPRDGWLRVAAPGADGRSSFTFEPGQLSAWPDLRGADLVFLHDWSMSRVQPERVDEAEHRIELAQPIGGHLPFFHITGFESHPRYALENLRAAWTAEGEWIHDSRTGRVHYRPLPGEDPASTPVVIPVLERLVEVRGAAGSPVRGLTFQGITFAHTRAMEPAGGYAGIQAAFHDRRTEPGQTGELAPTSAVRVSHGERIAFEDCRFEQLGASALWLGEGVRNGRVARCTFTDVGANGLMIGAPTEPEEPDALTSTIVCEDSLVEHCGVLYHGAVGIWIGIAREVSVRHNELRALPYTAISLGWIWDPRPSPSRGHVIERNHIHHVMQLLSDGGGIYTLGSQPDTFLRHNLIHDVPVNAGRAGSNGFFVDQGSNAMVFEGNVIHSVARSPIRFHMAGANELRANVLVTADDVPPFRYDACNAELMEFEANRIVAPADWAPTSAADLKAGPR